MDWRDIGEQIYEHVKAEQWAADLKRQARKDTPRTTDQELDFALISCARGDSDPLIEFLLSDNDFSLSKDHREHLARVLRHKFWVPRQGRRPKGLARWALGYAQRIFLIWKAANKETGISDWGLRDQMKDQACRYAIEICRAYTDGQEADFETVRGLMERSKKRQTHHRPPPAKRRQNRKRVSP
ncbi:MAG: hypothetical protein ACR2GC_10580 [Methyloceanibacter sp.]|uniref:hypothetical protein n=1 Tax=Methyloceanibacter sp. TaxID=1965321 RepID=UPI003D9B2654